MNDLLKTFIQTWNYENPDRPIAVEDDEWGLLIYMYPNGRNGETCDIDITNDRTSATALIVILDALEQHPLIDCVSIGRLVTDVELRTFSCDAWDRQYGRRPGGMMRGKTRIEAAIALYNAVYTPKETA